MNNIGLPLLLLAAIWGMFSPVLKAIEMLTERRDKILDEKSDMTFAHRRLILYSDWIPLFIFTCSFVAFVGILVYLSPRYIDLGQFGMDGYPIMTTMVAIFMFVLTAGGLIGGTIDFFAVRKALNDLKSRLKRIDI